VGENEEADVSVKDLLLPLNPCFQVNNHHIYLLYRISLHAYISWLFFATMLLLALAGLSSLTATFEL